MENQNEALTLVSKALTILNENSLTNPCVPTFMFNPIDFEMIIDLLQKAIEKLTTNGG